MKDLTNSNIDRQNILNNRYSLEKIQNFIGLPGMLFDGATLLLSKNMTVCA
jgi:hypothetical protein